MSGIAPKFGQRLAGHHDPSFTLRVYAKVRGEDMPTGEALGLVSE